MKKINKIAFFAFVVLFSISIVAPVYRPLQAQTEIGIDEYVRHDWQITNIDMSYTVYDTAGHAEPIQNYTDDLLNQLEGAKLTFILGEKYPDEGVIYIVPVISIENDFEVSAEFLNETMEIPLEDAQDLAFTIPRGSAIIVFMPYDAMTFLGVLSAFTEQVVHPNQYGAFLGSTPYPYGEAYPPAPMVNASALSDIGAEWEDMDEEVEGITFEYTEEAGTATFTASGSNTTEYEEEGYYNYVSVSIDTCTMEYSLTTGILQRIEMDMDIFYNETWYDEYDEKWVYHIEDVSISLLIEHVNAAEVDIAIEPGDKLGFKVSEFTMTEDLIDTINETMEGGFTQEMVDMINSTVYGIKTVFKYNETNEIYPSGLDILYNVTTEIPIPEDGIEKESSYALMNVMQLGAPYILPEHDLIFGDFQFWSHLYLKILPKFLKYMYEQSEDYDPNMTFDITGDYSVLRYGDNEYVAAKASFTYDFNYQYTIPAKAMNKTDATIEGQSWIIYDGDGYLTEIHYELSFNAKIDTNADNATDKTYSGSLSITINRVQNTAAGEPNWDSVIDPPSFTEAGWEDVTPYKAGAGGAEGIFEFLSAIPPEYIAVGAVGLVVVIGLILWIRRR